MKWFKHQADANLNAKLQEIILDHGMEGYGLYWFCIELVAMNVSSSKLTFELEHDARIISRMSGLAVSKVELIMKDFISLDLFSASEGRIQCLKLANRSDDFTAKAIRQNGLQPLDLKGVRQSPTKSEKVPLEEEVRSKNLENKNIDRSSAPIREKNSAKQELIADTFEHWWKLFPTKLGKKKASSIWNNICKKKTEDQIADLTDAISVNIVDQIEKEVFGFDRLHPTTYLNQERWNDELPS